MLLPNVLLRVPFPGGFHGIAPHPRQTSGAAAPKRFQACAARPNLAAGRGGSSGGEQRKPAVHFRSSFTGMKLVDSWLHPCDRAPTS